MADFDNNSFGRIPHGWFDDNEFIDDLTNAQKWILVCLAGFIWRVKYPDLDKSKDKILVKLYEQNRLLVTLMAERTIEEKTGFNRSTIETATKKFDDCGAVIKLSGKKGNGHSNIYIMGFERREKNKKGPEKRTDFFFSNSPILRAGGIIPDDVKDFIKSNYDFGHHTLHETLLPGYDDKVGNLIFSNNSPLIPKDDSKAIDIDDFRRSKSG